MLGNLTRKSFLRTAGVMCLAGTGLTFKSHAALADTSSGSESSSGVKKIRSCCRACGKNECGVYVYVEDGRVIRIEGDEDGSFQSQGNCCSKSQASMQAAYHPDRLKYPMKRTTPKGEDPGWVRISWDEAMEIYGAQMTEITEKYGPLSTMTFSGTSRIWGSAPTYGITGTSNRHAALQICKGPRIFVGTMMDFFGSYWLANTDEIENRVYVQWGTECAYSNYDTSCRVITDVRGKAKAHIIIDPRLTPMGKEADIWLPVRPGTDGAIAMAWLRLVIEEELYDDLFVKRWTNAPFLYCPDIEPSGYRIRENMSATDVKTRLLKESDLKEDGVPSRYMVWDNLNNRLTWFDAVTSEWENESYESVKPTTGREICGGWLPDPSQFNPAKDPALYGEFEVTLKDGRKSVVVPVWEKLREKCEKYTLDYAAEVTGVEAEKIGEACRLWATRDDPTMSNGAIHYQLATDQCGNAFQTIRAIQILNDIVGTLDGPAGGRGPSAGTVSAVPTPLYPASSTVPLDQVVKTWDKNAQMASAEKFPLLRWWDNWADASSLYDQVLSGDPYPIVAATAITGNFMNQGNTMRGWEALKKLTFFCQSDMWHVPMSDMADILLPCAHWLELNFPRLSQGATGGQGATVKCIEPPGEALPDAELMCRFYKAMGKPFNLVDPENDPWPDAITQLNYYVQNTGMTWEEYVEEFQKNGWWDVKKLTPERWGTYHRYEMGQLHTQAGFAIMPLSDNLPGFWTNTRKVEIWATIPETYLGDEWEKYVLPDFVEPMQGPVTTPDLMEEYPFILTTGSRNPTFFHSEHRQLPWCRELWPVPRIELNPKDAEKIGVKQGDWVWIENEMGKVREAVDIYWGIKEGVANANHQWWFPELNQPGHGFDLCAINVLQTPENQDPLCGASTLRAYPVKIYKATPENSPFGNPVPCGNDGTEIIVSSDDPRLKEWVATAEDYEGRELQ